MTSMTGQRSGLHFAIHLWFPMINNLPQRQDLQVDQTYESHCRCFAVEDIVQGHHTKVLTSGLVSEEAENWNEQMEEFEKTCKDETKQERESG